MGHSRRPRPCGRSSIQFARWLAGMFCRASSPKQQWEAYEMVRRQIGALGGEVAESANRLATADFEGSSINTAHEMPAGSRI